MRRISITLAALLAAAGIAAVRPDAAAAQDNTAVAVNTKDGASVFRLAFSINRVARDVVDNTNAAVAVSSCAECQTVAIAIQVVLITGDATVVTPTNLAIALNVECTACETLASAYQYVFDTDGAQVHFSAEGNQTLARIRQDLLQLRHAELPAAELQGRLDPLMNELLVVLRNELVIVGRSHEPPVATTPTEPETTTGTTDDAPPPSTETTTEPVPATDTVVATTSPTDATQSTEVETETEPVTP